MNRTLCVRGEGSVRLVPDRIRLEITLRASNPDSARAMAAMEEQLASLKQALENEGFAPDALKTADYAVEAQRENVPDERGIYREVFTGFACVQHLALEFAADNMLLSKALTAVSICEADPELNVRYLVSDRRAAEEQLLRAAAENARRSAELLAGASGVTLGELISIRYDRPEHDLFSRSELRYRGKAAVYADAAFSPEEIELSDSAVFVWVLE